MGRQGGILENWPVEETSKTSHTRNSVQAVEKLGQSFQVDLMSQAVRVQHDPGLLSIQENPEKRRPEGSKHS